MKKSKSKVLCLTALVALLAMTMALVGCGSSTKTLEDYVNSNDDVKESLQ